MYNFLRISSVYPTFLNQFNKFYYDSNDNYEALLKKLFSQNYSISNNITKALSEINYQCIEIVENANLIQNKWLQEYGDKNSSENIIIQQIKYYKPDIIYIGNASLADKFLIENIKKNTKVKKIFCFNCAPLTNNIIKNLKNVDGVITCTQGYKEQILNRVNNNVLLMRHCFNSKVKTKTENNSREIDITFIGSIFLKQGLHMKRVSLIYKLFKNFKNNYIAINFSKYFFVQFLFSFIRSIFFFKIHKNFSFYLKLLFIYFFSKKPIFGNEMLNILKKTKILINTHIDDTEYAGNMRLFEGTGMGCLVITDQKKDLDKLFKIGNEIETFKSEDELIKKCNYFLKNEDELSKISNNGYLRTLNDHNYKDRVLLLDKFIQNIVYEKNI